MDNINWLQGWYRGNCDGNWEHEHGIDIQTLDNPGWLVKIDMKETIFENKTLEKFSINKGDEDWLSYYIKDGVFYGYGDCSKLDILIKVFKDCVTS